MRQGWVWLAVMVVLASCAPAPPRVPERVYRTYVPGMIGAPNKLGVAGCGCGALGCNWCYNWSPWPAMYAGVEAVPMIRDAGQMHVTLLGGDSDWIMGFNEPDLPGQANMTPDEAAVLWREIEGRWPGRRLLGPAPSHLHPEWIVQFRDAYMRRYGQAPRLDGLAFHCYYRYASQCIALGERFVRWADEWGSEEVWCTEFAFLPVNGPDAERQARRFVAWLEGEPGVTRYAPYVVHQAVCDQFWPDCRPGADPSLLDAAGGVTEIGRWYAKAFF